MRPHSFEVNRTWLAFRVNKLPVTAGEDTFDIFVLQDAASMFIFGFVFAPDGAESPSVADVVALMDKARSRTQEWPEEIVLPGKPSQDNSFVCVAKRNGVGVRTVAKSEMSYYIKDVQTSFENFLSDDGKRDA
jgi:hypothetical protein